MNNITLRERERQTDRHRALLTDKKKMGTKGGGWARPSTASDWLGERERKRTLDKRMNARLFRERCGGTGEEKLGHRPHSSLNLCFSLSLSFQALLELTQSRNISVASSSSQFPPILCPSGSSAHFNHQWRKSKLL